MGATQLHFLYLFAEVDDPATPDSKNLLSLLPECLQDVYVLFEVVALFVLQREIFCVAMLHSLHPVIIVLYDFHLLVTTGGSSLSLLTHQHLVLLLGLLCLFLQADLWLAFHHHSAFNQVRLLFVEEWSI